MHLLRPAIPAPNLEHRLEHLRLLELQSHDLQCKGMLAWLSGRQPDLQAIGILREGQHSLVPQKSHAPDIGCARSPFSQGLDKCFRVLRPPGQGGVQRTCFDRKPDLIPAPGSFVQWSPRSARKALWESPAPLWQSGPSPRVQAACLRPLRPGPGPACLKEAEPGARRMKRRAG
jgi:hypothetical protein